MFQHLSEFPVILVTGPQRSGTRIAARCIAHDTGHRFVDEREIHTDSLYELMQVIKYQRTEPVVVQCPALCYAMLCGGIGYASDVAVVLVRRDVSDIRESQDRVKWNWAFVEHFHYANAPSPGLSVAQRKYWYWDTCQKRRILNPFEVEYEGLSEHPLWVPKEQRKDFDAWQTEIDSET